MRREGNSKVTAQSAGRPADAEYGVGIHFLLELHCAFAFSNSREWNSKVYLMGRKFRRGRPRPHPEKRWAVYFSCPGKGGGWAKRSVTSASRASFAASS